MPTPFCVTEADAKEKWCPATRFHQPRFGDPMTNKTGLTESTGCLGSDCMAWRFVLTHIDDGDGGLKSSGDTHGYCGIAGPTAVDMRQ